MVGMSAWYVSTRGRWPRGHYPSRRDDDGHGFPQWGYANLRRLIGLDGRAAMQADIHCIDHMPGRSCRIGQESGWLRLARKKISGPWPAPEMGLQGAGVGSLDNRGKEHKKLRTSSFIYWNYKNKPPRERPRRLGE